ncbi:MAG: DUF2330 domain-containing protein [Acidimicrobiia bacterium]
MIGDGPVAACGFLVAPNGTVQLKRPTTAVFYADGIEHYITSFEYGGGNVDFGSIIPLPDVPTSVERGGEWTLQRLVKEITPSPAPCATCSSQFAASDEAEVLLQTKIDALEITVLRGGAAEVVEWAESNGFQLPDDASDQLGFYAERSPIFMAARFDTTTARELGQFGGDGTPIHVTVPTGVPWVPLRILGMAKAPDSRVEADVFLLTESAPNMLPLPHDRMALRRSEPASAELLDDLRSDEGMGFVPEKMWLTYLAIDAPASSVTYELAIEADGVGLPSLVDTGLTRSDLPTSEDAPWATALVIIGSFGIVMVAATPGRRHLANVR